MTDQINSKTSGFPARAAIQFRTLMSTDGMALHRLVSECPPLDPNSSYCNLLQCSHFNTTSIAAFSADKLLGSITGYRVPDRPDTVFIWQVAVHSTARGQGLGGTMLRQLVARVAMLGVSYIETSITSDNKASWRLFEGLAAEHQAELVHSVMFEQSLHFKGAHQTEYQLRIGPIAQH